MAGAGAPSPPSEFSAHQRGGHGRPATLGMICPKSRHKSLAQAGSARDPQPDSLLLSLGEQQCWVREGDPSQGCMGHMRRGQEDSGELDVERGSQPRALATPGALLSPSV